MRRPKRGFTFVVERRLFNLRKESTFDTQVLRRRWIGDLEGLFVIATSIAKGHVKRQRFGDREEPISPKQRQLWAHVAAHIAIAMANLAKGYDERVFNEDLVKLERLVDEIKKCQVESVGAVDKGNQPDPESKDKGSESGVDVFG